MAGKNIKTFIKDKTNDLKSGFRERIGLIKFIYAALILNLINLAAVLLAQKHLPPQVPLFYGFTESEEQLTSPEGLFIPGIFSLVIVFINSFLSLAITNIYLKKIMSVTSFTISLLSLITVIKIILLVGFF